MKVPSAVAINMALIVQVIMCDSVHAQDVDGSISQLNTIFQGSASMKVDREDRLIIDLINEEGKYRQDVMYVEFLDPGNISYVSEERALVLRCLSEEENCIDKEVFKMKTIRHTGRSTLPLSPGSPDIDRATMLFSSLIEQIQAEADSETSETRRRR